MKEEKEKEKEMMKLGLQMIKMAAFQPPLEDLRCVETFLVCIWSPIPIISIFGATELSMKSWCEKLHLRLWAYIVPFIGTIEMWGMGEDTREILVKPRVRPLIWTSKFHVRSSGSHVSSRTIQIIINLNLNK